MIQAIYCVLVLVLVSSGEVSNLACLVKPLPDSLPVEDLHGRGKIIFIPTDDFPISKLEALSHFYHSSYGLDIAIASPLTLPSTAYNRDRKQFIAQEILGEAEKHYGSWFSQSTRVPIVFTEQDIYIEKVNWGYAFGLRRDGAAVVSSARMDYGFLSLWTASEETQDSRLRKMVTKNIGLLHYHLSLSNNCRSAMYNNIMGPRELDLMSDYL